jgi:hypothetical protein
LSVSEIPGFPCPQCGFRLIATLQTLLAPEPLRCGQCGLQLTLVPEQCADALKAVHELNQALEGARRSASLK